MFLRRREAEGSGRRRDRSPLSLLLGVHPLYLCRGHARLVAEGAHVDSEDEQMLSKFFCGDRLVTLRQSFVRKARNFAADPIGTSINQPHRMRAAIGQWHLEKNGVMDGVRAFQQLRPGHAVRGDPGDWWFLY